MCISEQSENPETVMLTKQTEGENQTVDKTADKSEQQLEPSGEDGQTSQSIVLKVPKTVTKKKRDKKKSCTPLQPPPRKSSPRRRERIPRRRNARARNRRKR